MTSRVRRGRGGFTRIKHGKRPLPFTTWELPFNAIDYCLGHSGIELADIDHIAYSYDPYLLLDKDTAQNASIALPLEPSKQKSRWTRFPFGSHWR